MGGGKGGGAGSAFDYYGSIAGVVCNGPVYALVRMLADGKEIWPAAKSWKTGEAITTNMLREVGGVNYKALSNHTAASGNKPPNATYWSEYILLAGSSDFTSVTVEGYGVFRIYWGTATQTQDPVLAAAGNDKGESHPPYKNICYVVLDNFLCGRERTSAPDIQVITRKKPNQTIVSGGGTDDLTDGQANLIAFASEVLTHSNGFGMANTALDSTSFQTAATALQSKEKITGCSPLVVSQQTFREFSQNLINYTDAWLRFNPATLKIEAGVFTHGVIPTSYTTLLIDDFTERPKFKAGGWNAVKTHAFITFNDRARAYKQTSDKDYDARALRVVGEQRPITFERPDITRRNQACKHVKESLRTIARPQLDGNVYVRREKGKTIRPGDWVLVDIDLEPGGSSLNQFFRVMNKVTPRRGPIKFKLDADELVNAVATEKAEDIIEEATLDVPDIVNARIVEAPVQLAGFKADHVMILAERPSAIVTGFQPYFDYDNSGTFQVLGDTRGFATRATLRSDHTNSTTTLQITVPAQVDSDRLSDTANDLNANDDQLLAILVEKNGAQIKEDSDEYSWIEVASISAMTLVSGTNYDLTVLRGRQQTKGRAFTSANCEVWIIPRHNLDTFEHARFEDLRNNRITGGTPSTGYFRLTPYTHDNTRDLADCASIQFVFPKASASGPVFALTSPTSTAVVYPLNWVTATAYLVGDIRWNGSTAYVCTSAHTSGASTEPGVGASWATKWSTTTVPYPYEFDAVGQWTDPNSDLVATQMTLELVGGADGEVLDEDDTFSPIGVLDYDETVHIPQNGTWKVRLKGYDQTGLESKRTIIVTARGSSTKCAKVKFSWAGKKIKGEEWNLYGKMKLKCATKGVTIHYRYRIVNDTTGVTASTGAYHTYDDSTEGFSTQPYGPQVTDSNTRIAIDAYASKTSYVDSDVNTIEIRYKRFGVTDTAP